jgi:hypothetical protein
MNTRKNEENAVEQVPDIMELLPKIAELKPCGPFYRYLEFFFTNITYFLAI